jgi:hypothetical protein
MFLVGTRALLTGMKMPFFCIGRKVLYFLLQLA